MTEAPHVAFMAMRWPGDHGMLRDRAHEAVENLRAALSGSYDVAEDAQKRRIEEMLACLTRLDGFHLQVARVASHAQRLEHPDTVVPPEMSETRWRSLFLAAHELCTDFESLLFHARAALDRMAWFVSAEHRQKCLYAKLRRVLVAAASKDKRARHLDGLLDNVCTIEGVLSRIGGTDVTDTALRHRITHYTSIAEGATHGFSIHRLPDNSILAFDCEALGYPVISTARGLARDVPYLIFNAMAIYSGLAEQLTEVEFEPPWPNPTVAFTEYIDPDCTGPIYEVYRARPSGFRIRREHLRADVISHACAPGTSAT
jgi:hypothetical protein